MNLAAGIALSAFAFWVKPIDVPAAAKEAFVKTHPGTTGKWEKEKGNYEVNFKEAGKTKLCVITGKGLETKTEVAVSELPAAVTDDVKMALQECENQGCPEIVKSNGEVNYEAGVNHKDAFFDKAGTFLKEAKN